MRDPLWPFLFMYAATWLFQQFKSRSLTRQFDAPLIVRIVCLMPKRRMQTGATIVQLTAFYWVIVWIAVKVHVIPPYWGARLTMAGLVVMGVLSFADKWLVDRLTDKEETRQREARMQQARRRK